MAKWCGNADVQVEDHSMRPNPMMVCLSVKVITTCLATGGKCTAKKGRVKECPNWKPGEQEETRKVE